MKKKLLVCVMLFMPTAKSETLIIGDSIFALTKEVPKNLEAAGLEFEMKAQVGAKIEQIARQYDEYKQEHGVPSLIIMDGGGNNILRENLLSCLRGQPACYRKVDYVVKFSQGFRDQLREDGVKRVILVGIHYFQGWRKPLNPVADYAMEKISCGNIVDDFCTLIDLREHFEEDGLLLIDGIHPNAKGSKIISDLILMEIQEMLYSYWR